MEQSSIIQTGVDRLVQLVKQSKRISVPDAAKTLNVSKVVVEEWADFCSSSEDIKKIRSLRE